MRREGDAPLVRHALGGPPPGGRHPAVGKSTADSAPIAADPVASHSEGGLPGRHSLHNPARLARSRSAVLAVSRGGGRAWPMRTAARWCRRHPTPHWQRRTGNVVHRLIPTGRCSPDRPRHPLALPSRSPTPSCHNETVADAVAAHRPIMVVISTPTYCQSRFALLVATQNRLDEPQCPRPGQCGGGGTLFCSTCCTDASISVGSRYLGHMLYPGFYGRGSRFCTPVGDEHTRRRSISVSP